MVFLILGGSQSDLMTFLFPLLMKNIDQNHSHNYNHNHNHNSATISSHLCVCLGDSQSKLAVRVLFSEPPR